MNLYIGDNFTGEADAIDPRERGTKVAPHYILEIPGGEERTVRVRFFTEDEDPKEYFGDAFEAVFDLRIKEADEFYDSVSKYVVFYTIQRERYHIGMVLRPLG